MRSCLSQPSSQRKLRRNTAPTRERIAMRALALAHTTHRLYTIWALRVFCLIKITLAAFYIDKSALHPYRPPMVAHHPTQLGWREATHFTIRWVQRPSKSKNRPVVPETAASIVLWRRSTNYARSISWSTRSCWLVSNNRTDFLMSEKTCSKHPMWYPNTQTRSKNCASYIKRLIQVAWLQDLVNMAWSETGIESRRGRATTCVSSTSIYDLIIFLI